MECSVLFSIDTALSAAACSCMFSGVKDMDTRCTAITIWHCGVLVTLGLVSVVLTRLTD